MLHSMIMLEVQHVEISLNSLPGRGVMDTFFTQTTMSIFKKKKKEENKGVHEPTCFTENFKK